MVYQDVDAEYRLLVSLMAHPERIAQITAHVFTDHRVELFRAIADAYRTYGVVTFESLRHVRIPPEMYVANVTAIEPLLVHLTDLALRRQAYEAAQRVLQRIQQSDMLTYSDVVKAAYIPPVLTTNDTSLEEGIERFLAIQQRKRNGTYQYVDTGLPFLNVALNGEWPVGGITVILGQPGGGKTALMCQSAIQMAQKNIPCMIFSLEMTKQRLVPRFLAYLAQVPLDRILSGVLNVDEEQRVQQALHDLQQLQSRIFIVDGKQSLTADDIAAMVHTHVQLYGVRAFFVDYLQLIAFERLQTMFEAYGDAVQTLSAVAHRTDAAGILLSQRNRQHEGLDAILGSSRVGQIADVVFEIRATEQQGATRTVEFQFLKNRDNALTSAVCYYHAPCLTFY